MSSINRDMLPLPISIAIPSSFIDIYSNNSQKTQQIGRIARAAAIFQVNQILVYLDKKNLRQAKNQQLITCVLDYMETPQYLRKYLFKKIPELRYAGLLPPLRTPHHPLAKKVNLLKPGEIRDGFAYSEKGKLYVDIGVETPLPLLHSQEKHFPKRITVKIQAQPEGNFIASPCAPPTPSIYWGYQVVKTERLLGEYLTDSTTYDFIIATSRRGAPLQNLFHSIRSEWMKSKCLLLLYGSHKEGLSEILGREGYKISSIATHSINFLPDQGTATIRTEEAICIGLSMFRFLERMTF